MYGNFYGLFTERLTHAHAVNNRLSPPPLHRRPPWGRGYNKADRVPCGSMITQGCFYNDEVYDTQIIKSHHDFDLNYQAKIILYILCQPSLVKDIDYV